MSASYHLVPHLTDRHRIYSFPNPWQGRNWGINDQHQRDPKSVEWLVVLKGDLGDTDTALVAVDPHRARTRCGRSTRGTT